MCAVDGVAARDEQGVAVVGSGWRCYVVSVDSDEARRARAAARAGWPVARYAMGAEPAEDLLGTTTAGERIAMVWRITQDAWAAMGRSIPEYERSEAPGRMVRLHERG